MFTCVLSGELIQVRLALYYVKSVLYLNLRSLHGGFQASMRRRKRGIEEDVYLSDLTVM